jgi:uncharacterized cysteine cluster protein YcgN (CxxCxxCC family)
MINSEKCLCEQYYKSCKSREKSIDLGASGVAQGVEYLPSKCKALCSNPSTVIKKKNPDKETQWS